MPSMAGKCLLGVASAALAAAALYPAYCDLTQRRTIAFFAGGKKSAGEAEAGAPAPGWEEPPPLSEDLPGVLDVDRLRFPPSAFVREPVTLERFAEDDQFSTADAFVNYRYKADLDLRQPWKEHPEGAWFQRTNSLGLREDEDVSAEQPDLRILIAGDSHTDGVCNNDEAFGNLVEAHLRREHPGRTIESLNAGRGGYSFYQYLGTLERFLYLRPDVFVVGVYGGNDFQDVLTLFHEYNGTKRPPGMELYQEQIERVLEVDPNCLAQAFLALKYFDAHPEEREVALQAARDVTTEILVACLRHAVHPIFVYIPAMPSTEWERQKEVFDEVAGILELSPEALRTTDAMADSYLAFLRELRVDAIDMREVFRRAGAGNFWVKDHHINLRAQQLIADELYQLVVAARPPDSARSRRAPASRGPKQPLAFLAPGSAASKALQAPPSSTWRQRQFDEVAMAALCEGRHYVVPDELAGYRYTENVVVPAAELGLGASFSFVTNGQGLREDADTAPAARLRVVVTGDEHVAGACPNPETFANLAEAELRRRHPGLSIDVLNAGVAGYTFQNYLGVLRRSLELEPDALVVAVSSGTDFSEGLRVDGLVNPRPFTGREDEPRDGSTLAEAEAISRPAVAQSLGSVKYFREHPARSKRAFDVALEALLEIRRLCAENGIELLVMHLPPAADVEWELHDATLEPVRAALGIAPEFVDANATLARALVHQLRSYGTEVVELGELFDGQEPFFDPVDFLIDTPAHRRIAAELVARLDDLAAALR